MEEKKDSWKLELDDLLEDYWGDTDDEKFGKTECRIFELVEQLLDRAREEGMFDRFELSYIKTLHSEARAYRKYMGVTLTEEGEKRDKDFISKLSKLTTK